MIIFLEFTPSRGIGEGSESEGGQGRPHRQSQAPQMRNSTDTKGSCNAGF